MGPVGDRTGTRGQMPVVAWRDHFAREIEAGDGAQAPVDIVEVGRGGFREVGRRDAKRPCP